MKYRVSLEGNDVDVDVERTATGWRVRLDGGAWKPVDGRWQGPDLRLATPDGDRLIGTHITGDLVDLQLDGTALRATVIDPRKSRSALGGGGAQGEVRTPMPGVVVRIPVAVGDAVTAGQVLVVVEAMKMENEFKAPVDGTVERIAVEVGQALESNALLVHLS